jgi:hypothetical protein
MKFFIVPVFILTFALVSCASSVRYNQVELQSARDSGDINACLRMARNTKKTKTDVIMRNLDIALLEHFAGSYESSLKTLNKTDLLMHDAVTKSISQGIGAAVLNENVKEYPGTVYEYLYINVFNALNYYDKGDLEEALVEVRKIGIKQKEYINEYGKAVLAELVPEDDRTIRDEDVAASFFGINMPVLKTKSPATATDKDIFRDSPTARYLSMVLRSMYNDSDNARVDRDVLAVLNPHIDTSGDATVSSNKGRLNILAFSGIASSRYEQTLYFPGDVMSGVLAVGNGVWGYGPGALLSFPETNGVNIPAFRIKFAYPAFDRRRDASRIASVRVVFNSPVTQSSVSDSEMSAGVTNLSLLEDFNDVIEKDVRTKAGTAFSRSVARSLVKKMSAVTAGTASLTAAHEAMIRNKNDLLGEMAYQLTYLSVSAAIEAVDFAETADVRQCHFLPAQAYAAGVTLEPGVYSFTVEYLDASSRVLSQQYFSKITVPAGNPVLVESSCIK